VVELKDRGWMVEEEGSEGEVQWKWKDGVREQEEEEKKSESRRMWE